MRLNYASNSSQPNLYNTQNRNLNDTGKRWGADRRSNLAMTGEMAIYRGIRIIHSPLDYLLRK